MALGARDSEPERSATPHLTDCRYFYVFTITVYASPPTCYDVRFSLPFSHGSENFGLDPIPSRNHPPTACRRQLACFVIHSLFSLHTLYLNLSVDLSSKLPFCLFISNLSSGDVFSIALCWSAAVLPMHVQSATRQIS